VNAVIKGVGAYLPERIMPNDEFTKFIDTSDEWIVSHTGIKYRRIASKTQAASDLALIASQKALDRAGISPKDLDLIILATATPDYHGFPSTACIVQDKLEATHAGALDISAACTGFIYGVEIARNFIKNNSAKNILVIAAEVLSRVLNWKDRNTCVLFGDGSGAVVISAEPNNNNRGVQYSMLHAEGSGSNVLQIPIGGSRNPFQNLNEHDKDGIYLMMEGHPVYKFAVRVITEMIRKVLKDNHLSIDDIAFIVPHQANIRIIEAAAKRLKISPDKFFCNLDKYANTSAASVPIALNDIYEQGLLKENDLILTVAFGGGLTYGANIIRW
jgi:3-oxoacyl-[acyl-carrier-protein] synthase-3